MRDNNTPLTGGGPTVEFAHELRELRSRAGLSFDEMALKAGYTSKTLCRAARGKRLPTWRVAKAFVSACAVPRPTIEGAWRKKWQEASRVSRIVTVSRTDRVTRPSDVTEMLLRVMRRREVTVEQLLEQAGAIQPPEMDDVAWTRPSAATLEAVLADRSADADQHVIILVLAACGAAHDDIDTWLKHRGIKRVLPGPAVAASPAPSHSPVGPAAGSPGEPNAPDPRPVRPPSPPNELIDRADASRRHAVRARRHRRPVLVSGLIVAFLGMTIGPVIVIRDTRPGRMTLALPAHPPPLGGEPRSRPAWPALSELADLAGRLPTPTPAGPVTYVHTTTSHFDDTSTAAEPYTVVDERLWWQPGHPGLKITKRDGQVTETRPPTPAIADIATDPGILARDLHTVSPGIDTPLHILQSVVRLYRDHCPGPRQLAAMLRLLADTRELRTTGLDRDRLGRQGLLVTATGSTTTELALFDTGTGALLSAETRRDPARGDTLGAPRTIESTVFHSCEHRAAAG